MFPGVQWDGLLSPGASTPPCFLFLPLVFLASKIPSLLSLLPSSCGGGEHGGREGANLATLASAAASRGAAKPPAPVPHVGVAAGPAPSWGSGQWLRRTLGTLAGRDGWGWQEKASARKEKGTGLVVLRTGVGGGAGEP